MNVSEPRNRSLPRLVHAHDVCCSGYSFLFAAHLSRLRQSFFLFLANPFCLLRIFVVCSDRFLVCSESFLVCSASLLFAACPLWATAATYSLSQNLQASEHRKLTEREQLFTGFITSQQQNSLMVFMKTNMRNSHYFRRPKQSFSLLLEKHLFSFPNLHTVT